MRLTFVVCPSYHGATLLALLLNNHSQISALGDMLPLRAIDLTCACGSRVSECDFWQTVRDRVDTSRFSTLERMLPVMPWPLSRRQVEGGLLRLSTHTSFNHAAGRIAGAVTDTVVPAVWKVWKQPVSNFVETYQSFYRTVLDLHGTTMFVDGNKSWRKAALLARRLGPAADIKIVHVVRDPRGFAVSSCGRGESADLSEATLRWVELHRRMASLASLGPYRLLRYEDLCAKFDVEMRALFEFLTVEPEDVLCAPKYEWKHHIVGNRMLRTFDGRVVLDERWRTKLTVGDQRTVLEYAGPLAERLGYTTEDAEGATPNARDDAARGGRFQRVRPPRALPPQD